MSSISGIYTALSGMAAQRRILDVTAHNVANEATEGYHRQRVELRAAGVGSVAAVFAGEARAPGGVDVSGVTRIDDQLAEARLLRETAGRAGTRTTSANLERIEMAFPEPGEDGIAALLDELWSGWSDLSSMPGDLATRNQVLERAETVVDALRRASADLDGIESSSRGRIITLTADVNDLATRIAELNAAVSGSTGQANDLLDQRDLAVKQLAALTGAVARPAVGGQVDVYIGGRAIVSGNVRNAIDGSGGVLRWVADGSPVAAPTSEAGALAQTINDVVPRYRAALDGVAAGLVASVNGLHQAGYDQAGATGWNFFDPAGVTAATIALSTDVVDQPQRLAAGAPVFPGPVAPGPFDGAQAAALAGLAGSATGPDSDYRTLISQLGVEVRGARRRDGIQEQVTAAAEAQVASTSAVSIDEEMATLMAAQRGYEASARVLTALDEMLGVLIQRTGVVGR